ncbi:hypothetical protein AY599_13385 [Leptolyngbya valderiana BDU 20041]|nr:hypothetical protein AY599_13385 [Leptolyngbya valderiana BDU 20041]
MRSIASTWTRALHVCTALGLLMLAGGLMANTPVSSPIVNLDPQVEYSPADAQGRFTYMIEFVEPGVIAQHRARSNAEFDYGLAANQAAREQLVAIQAQRVSEIAQVVGRSVQPSHHYLATRNGIALRLSAAEAERVASMGGVKSIQREQLYSIQTFRGPEFIGANAIWDGSATPDGSPLRGELMVAAILDSGIPDPTVHPSFTNDPACGHGTGGVPDKVISNLDCSASDPGTGLCNGTTNPFDENGHGSHTASTTAGNIVTNSATPSPNLPAPFTQLSGVAHCAHIRSYDVCSANGGQSCGGADIAAGLESVIVHTDPGVIGAIPPVAVMNYSISGGRSPWSDFDRTKLDLVDAGVFVAASAGNTSAGEPDPIGLVSHRGPWVMSVAASTHDGQIGKSVSLAGGPTDVFAIEGSGPALTTDFIGDLRWAGDVDAANVEGCSAFTAGAFAGEAALISRGGCSFADKVNNAVAAGATFVIVYNNAGAPIVMGGLAGTTVSSVMISTDDGNAMIATLNGGVAEVTVPAADAGFVVPSAGDVLAGFSLRGPTPAPLQDLQKPNITAPGVNILAGVPGGFAFLSGTSMSGPHVAGAGVLVRQANPDWTVSEVKSALQLTASRGGLKDDGVTPWDWDDVGHGRVDLNDAALAGFVMDETVANYLAADPNNGGDVKTLNTPDVRNMNCSPSCSFTRTIRNTYDVATSWTVTPESFNPDLDIQVTPSTFSFTGDTSETVELTIDIAPQANLTAAIEFGQILFDEDGGLAPQAHFTVAISGSPSEPAAAAIDETEFTILVEEGNSSSASFNISNVGTGANVEDLTYTIAEAAPATVVLGNREANPPQTIDLVLDQGIATIIGVDEQEILWFNQFTPTPLDVPFTLETVDVAFAPGNAGVNAGDVFDVHVWVDPDGDPTNGATLVSSVVGEVVTAGVNFQTVTLPAGVDITAEDGNVLIGVVNRTTLVGTPYRPAVADAPGTANGESWIAFNFPGGVAGDPPVFGDAATFAPIGALLPDRNWTIRGTGTGGSACLTPSDVPWLTVTPASGSVPVDTSQEVVIDVDSTGLAQGTYEARLCIETNDVNNPVFVLPVTFVVTEVGGLPTIGVSPASLTGSVDVLNPTGGSALDISNTGTALDLEISVEEAETVTAAVRGNPTLSVNGVEVFEGLGTPANSSVTLNIGAGNAVTGVGYEVTIEAFSPSWLSESRMAILSNAGDPIGTGAEIIPVDGTNASGVETVSSGGIIALGSPVAANGAGEIYIEWFESFNDTTPAPDSVWSDSAAPVSLPPGITLQCTDQAACDAALGGGPPPSACDSPSDISWLDVTPATATIAPGDTGALAVAYDATGLAPGTYEAVICINSNDPVTPVVEVPVSLEVTVPANAAEIVGTVQGLGYCQADPILAAGAGIEIVGALETINLTADANGAYAVFLDEANGPVDITASAPSHISATQSGVAIAGQTTTTADFGLVLELPCAQVSPASFGDVFTPGGPTTGSYAMTIDNALGGAQLEWGIQEASTAGIGYEQGLPGGGELIANVGGDRDNDPMAERPVDAVPFVDPAPQGGPISSNFSEAFDDITTLPGAGWSLQNLSEPLGTSDWFQGNDTVFPAHEGASNAYIGANFNNTTGGTGVISNWLMTPEIELFNGTQMSFWTRVPSNAFPDRLEVRLSTSGPSTFAGASSTDVGDFDTLLLSIDPNLEGNYPTDWTEFTVTVSGLAAPTSGRLAFRYFVTDAGPSGTNSNYIGIDTVSVAQPTFCQSPTDIPWLSVDPFFGAAGIGESDIVDVSVDATGLDAGTYDAFICVNTSDANADLIQIPFSIEVLGDGIFQDRFED